MPDKAAEQLHQMVISMYGNDVDQETLNNDHQQLHNMLIGLVKMQNGVLGLTMMVTGAPPEIVASTGVEKELAIAMTMARVVAVEIQCMDLKKQIANLENELVDFRSAGQFDIEALQS